MSINDLLSLFFLLVPTLNFSLKLRLAYWLVSLHATKIVPGTSPAAGIDFSQLIKHDFWTIYHYFF